MEINQLVGEVMLEIVVGEEAMVDLLVPTG